MAEARTTMIYPGPTRLRPTKTVGFYREQQEASNLEPPLRKIKLFAGPRKALRR